MDSLVCLDCFDVDLQLTLLPVHARTGVYREPTCGIVDTTGRNEARGTDQDLEHSTYLKRRPGTVALYLRRLPPCPVQRLRS